MPTFMSWILEVGRFARFTNEASTDVVPSWSRDGRWIYFASDRSGEWQSVEDVFGRRTRRASDAPWRIWRIRIDSTEVPVLHKRRDRSGNMAYSDDGRRRDRSHRLSGSRVLGLLGHSRERHLLPRYDSKTRIVFFDFTTHRATRVFDLESRPAREATGMAVSPDGGTILYTQLDALSRDIILVENFR